MAIKVSSNPAKFSGLRHSFSGDIVNFVYNVVLQENVYKSHFILCIGVCQSKLRSCQSGYRDIRVYVCHATL